MEHITLYHTGFEKIEQPDIHIGRANADFGQGFYLSDNGDFSRRWARSRRGETTWLNTYTLALDGLLSREQSLRLLMIGPVYRQTAIKTERAASRLRFISAQVIEEKEIAAYRDKVLEEQEAYQKEFAEVMSALLNVQDAKGMRP